ncbi:hypothetical protein ACFUCT_23295 [Streptomyces parvus]|uniref:hypothetical protein n=1 Tax=Streptomyces parvus TaxID=66428 RepID=UPI003634C6A5
MPRLQILQLPEGASEDIPPFALVIDQVPSGGPLYRRFAEDIDLNDSIAARTGARAVLVFQDTVDIPANQEVMR